MHNIQMLTQLCNLVTEKTVHNFYLNNEKENTEIKNDRTFNVEVWYIYCLVWRLLFNKEINFLFCTFRGLHCKWFFITSSERSAIPCSASESEWLTVKHSLTEQRQICITLNTLKTNYACVRLGMISRGGGRKVRNILLNITNHTLTTIYIRIRKYKYT